MAREAMNNSVMMIDTQACLDLHSSIQAVLCLHFTKYSICHVLFTFLDFNRSCSRACSANLSSSMRSRSAMVCNRQQGHERQSSEQSILNGDTL